MKMRNFTCAHKKKFFKSIWSSGHEWLEASGSAGFGVTGWTGKFGQSPVTIWS